MASLAPARTKYRKVQKGSNAGNAKRGNTLAFGEFGLQSLTRGSMTGAQIEAARVAISRHLKRKGKLWIRVFPHKPITKKPAETRMGHGKGPVEYYVKSSPASSYSNSEAPRSKWPKRRSASQTPSCRSCAASSPATTRRPEPRPLPQPLSPASS